MIHAEFALLRFYLVLITVPHTHLHLLMRLQFHHYVFCLRIYVFEFVCFSRRFAEGMGSLAEEGEGDDRDDDETPASPSRGASSSEAATLRRARACLSTPSTNVAETELKGIIKDLLELLASKK